MALQSINPCTGAVTATVESHDEAEVERRLQLSSESFHRHRKTSFAMRSEGMLRAAEILEEEADNFGRLMVEEMGKPLKAAIDEARKCALGCRFYAENAEAALRDKVIPTNASMSLSIRKTLASGKTFSSLPLLVQCRFQILPIFALSQLGHLSGAMQT